MGKWSRDATSLLIEEVKKLPFLYDPSNKRYHDRRARRAAMHNIGLVLSEIRPDTTSEEVRIRWSALRSAFQGSISKMKRQMNSTQGSEFTKVWYFDDMLFLLDVRPPKNGFYHTANEGGETMDSTTQNEDICHSVTTVEETMDVPPDEYHLSEALSPENCSRKVAVGKNHQRENFQRENQQMENYLRENQQVENYQRGNIQMENHPMENHLRENIQMESIQVEDIQRESHQREDRCITDSVIDRGPTGDSGGNRRKRNYEIAFYQTLDYAMKKLTDRATEDADFIFGKLVSYELKSLNSPILRKKLKHKILMDIIEIQKLQD